MKFYVLALRKYVDIPDSKVKYVAKKGRKFAVGTYKYGKKDYQCWKAVSAFKKK